MRLCFMRFCHFFHDFWSLFPQAWPGRDASLDAADRSWPPAAQLLTLHVCLSGSNSASRERAREPAEGVLGIEVILLVLFHWIRPPWHFQLAQAWLAVNLPFGNRFGTTNYRRPKKGTLLPRVERHIRETHQNKLTLLRLQPYRF